RAPREIARSWPEVSGGPRDDVNRARRRSVQEARRGAVSLGVELEPAAQRHHRGFEARAERPGFQQSLALLDRKVRQEIVHRSGKIGGTAGRGGELGGAGGVLALGEATAEPPRGVEDRSRQRLEAGGLLGCVVEGL